MNSNNKSSAVLDLFVISVLAFLIATSAYSTKKRDRESKAYGYPLQTTLPFSK